MLFKNPKSLFGHILNTPQIKIFAVLGLSSSLILYKKT